jgi:tetratricopeptide (TPR) repeat protein
LFFPVTAARAATLADLQVAIIQEDYKKANDIAQELQTAKLSRDDGQESRYYLALSDLRLGEYARAEEVFKKLLGEKLKDDLYDKTAAGHIDALYLQGFYENALKEADGLISRRGHSDMLSLFYLKAARANLKLAHWSRAQELLKKIIETFPDSFESGVARRLLEEKQYFTVQVGAFAEKMRAEKLVADLSQRKEYAYIVETRGTGSKLLYRVRVGQLSTLNDAKELETKLSGLGYPTLIYP